jgi:hypothetical protein
MPPRQATVFEERAAWRGGARSMIGRRRFVYKYVDALGNRLGKDGPWKVESRDFSTFVDFQDLVRQPADGLHVSQRRAEKRLLHRATAARANDQEASMEIDRDTRAFQSSRSFVTNRNPSSTTF